MLLSHKTTIKINRNYSNIIGHMCYAAYKLWNVCNYERVHYKELALPAGYPDWYYQKKAHKSDLWYKQLPSQTAQEVCKLLDKSWKSFYTLKKTNGIQNPRPPKFKHDPIAVTYMQNAVVHCPGSDMVRLSVPKKLTEYMESVYGISDHFIYLENKIFKTTDTIKQIKIYPPENNECCIIIIYEVDDVARLSDNGKYLSIDLGLHNLMTCYDSSSGDTFIVGRKYLSYCNYFNKEIAKAQSQWAKSQYAHGIKYPKTSNHVRKFYKKKNDTINDYLHKCTRYIVSYCKCNDIHTVVIGNITNIRKDNSLGSVTNQKLHSLPYNKIYIMLEYKLAAEGICFVKQKESYSSQCSPLMPIVSKNNACRSNRVKRGLYRDGNHSWNADCVGAFNILRLYFQKNKINICLDPMEIKSPHIVKVAA